MVKQIWEERSDQRILRTQERRSMKSNAWEGEYVWHSLEFSVSNWCDVVDGTTML